MCVCETWTAFSSSPHHVGTIRLKGVKAGTTVRFMERDITLATDCYELEVRVRRQINWLVCAPCSTIQRLSDLVTFNVLCDEIVIPPPPAKREIVHERPDQGDPLEPPGGGGGKRESGKDSDPVTPQQKPSGIGPKYDPNPSVDRVWISRFYSERYMANDETYTRGEVKRDDLYVGDLADAYKYMAEHGVALRPDRPDGLAPYEVPGIPKGTRYSYTEDPEVWFPNINPYFTFHEVPLDQARPGDLVPTELPELEVVVPTEKSEVTVPFDLPVRIPGGHEIRDDEDVAADEVPDYYHPPGTIGGRIPVE